MPGAAGSSCSDQIPRRHFPDPSCTACWAQHRSSGNDEFASGLQQQIEAVMKFARRSIRRQFELCSSKLNAAKSPRHVERSSVSMWQSPIGPSHVSHRLRRRPHSFPPLSRPDFGRSCNHAKRLFFWQPRTRSAPNAAQPARNYSKCRNSNPGNSSMRSKVKLAPLYRSKVASAGVV